MVPVRPKGERVCSRGRKVMGGVSVHTVECESIEMKGGRDRERGMPETCERQNNAGVAS